MIRFRDMKIRTKLAVTFLIVLVPLIAAEVISIRSFGNELRESSELKLSNIVHHLHRLVRARQLTESSGETGTGPVAGAARPTPEDVSHLDEIFRTFRIDLTGYPYIMDSKGTLVIHPEQAGENIYDRKDSKGFPFIQSICERAVKLGPNEVGTIRYPWRSEEDVGSSPRMKLLKFMYFKDWDWIVAVGAYEEEVYGGLRWIKLYMIATMGFTILLVVALTLLMNRLLTSPIERISVAANRMAAGDLSHRVEMKRGGDEIATLARSFNVMAGQIKDKTDHLEGIVGERTAELKESREMYRSLVESTLDGIVTADLSGTITFANSGLERILGLPREAIIGRRIWEFYVGGLDEAREIKRLLKDKGGLPSLEMEFKGKDGAAIPIRSSASVLFDSEGNARGTLGIFSDISAEKALKNELSAAQAHLVQSMKMRALGDVVAGVAHEINNPLMAAATILHVMSTGECMQDCPNKPRMDVIKRCHDRIEKIVNHMREFSRQTVFERREMHINQPIRDALLITEQQLLNMQVVIEKDLDDGLPTIIGDTNRLEQVFLDIIANARDAMEGIDREKILRVRSHASEMDGRPAVAVEISDTGPGIKPEIRDKIFEPFFTTKEVGKGTGLGLMISFSIIEEHKGRIEVHDPPEGGACMVILIPVKPPVASADQNGGEA